MSQTSFALAGWYGIPVRLVPENGVQFTSHEFTSMARTLDCQIIYTKPYHPEDNRLIEHWHLSFKASLMARLDRTNWITHLPWVLLGSADTNMTLAEILFGQQLLLPSQFLSDCGEVAPAPDFPDKLRDALQSSMPATIVHRNTSSTDDIIKYLRASSHAYLG